MAFCKREKKKLEKNFCPALCSLAWASGPWQIASLLSWVLKPGSLSRGDQWSTKSVLLPHTTYLANGSFRVARHLSSCLIVSEYWSHMLPLGTFVKYLRLSTIFQVSREATSRSGLAAWLCSHLSLAGCSWLQRILVRVVCFPCVAGEISAGAHDHPAVGI